MKKHKHTENNNIPKQELENENLETKQTKQNQKQEKKDPLLERIDVLTCKNNELEKDVNNWKNKYYEAYANLENTRKQIEKDNNEYRKYMAIQVIENLIPCFDAMEATIKFAPEDPQIKKFLQGFNMIFNMFLKRLEEITELLKDEKGQVAGAVLQNVETDDYLVARAKTVVIATGGAGRMHYQGFPTSNHYGATADGLILGYRAGAPLLYQDTIQYHPTGVAFPSQIFGALVTEKVRSLGAQLVNIEGEAFMHPLETRDVAAAGIIRECTAREKGVTTPLGSGVWLDTPMIELLGGEGTIEKRIPAMLRMYLRYDIDMRKVPILVYPTLHYQNGGLEINGDGFTKIMDNLLVAGEAVGGIHGRNRLMGNSLLDIIVFGRNAGKAAAAKAKDVSLGTMNLDHLAAYAEELKEAGLDTHDVSPLLLPKYARHER